MMISSFQLNVVSAIFLASAIVSFVLAFVSLSKKNIDGIYYFTTVPFLFAIWSFFNCLGYATSDISLKILFTKCSYIGLTPSSISLLIFAAHFSGATSTIKARYFNFLYLFPLLFIVSAFTNDYHFFQWTSYIVKPSIVGQAVFYKSGLGVWFLSIFSWVASIISVYLLIRKLTFNHKIYRKQVVLVIVAFLLPWSSDMLFLFRILPYSEIDWTPVAFTFTALLIYLSIVKYNSFELVPHAKEVLFESMNNPVVVLNDRLVVCDFNPKATELFGLKNKIGEDICALFPEISPTEITDAAHKSLEIRRTIHDNRLWFDLSISIILNRKKRVTGYMLLFKDITATKLYQEQLIFSENELKKANDSKDKFFSIIAHDLRNPFHTLTGISEILLSNVEKYPTEKIKLLSQTIYDTSRETHTLLDNLLTWAHLQTGGIQPHLANAIPSDLIRTAVVICQPQADAKQVKLNVATKCNLPVRVDEQMIKTVLRNLVSNAIKFSYPDSTVQIETRAEQNGSVLFVVSDCGTGIEQEHIEKLFLIENKLSKQGTNNEKGSGLGLILCNEFIEANNGKIWAESQIGAGSSFMFTLPLWEEGKR